VTKRPALGCLVEIVQTDSMERTLEPGQYVLVDKLTPRFDTYKRGDIVVFRPPAATATASTPYIKRVIGVPGDTVEVRDDGLVYINDVANHEPYLYGDEPGGVPQATTVSLEQASWSIGEGEFFLMGDHRSDSADSRVFGAVAADQIIGRAWLRYWPLDTFGVLAGPS
jgi:signal peptidase I